jgi:hypothetical protein
VQILNSFARSNRQNGLRLADSPFFLLSNVTGSMNQQNGVLFGIAVDNDDAEIVVCRFDQNGMDGIAAGDPDFDLLRITNTTTNLNGDDGMDIDTVMTTQITSCTVNQNQNNGIELYGGNGLDDLFRTATVLSSQMIGNTAAGVWVDGDTNPADCVGDTTVLIGTAPGNGNRIEGNAVGIDVYGGCVIAKFNDIGTEGGGTGNGIGARLNENDGYLELECNQIRGNTQGVVNAGGPTIQAIINWWGAASGPSGVGTGTGDSVTAGVNFTPWATDPLCATTRGTTFSGGYLVVVGGSGRDTITVSLVGANVEVKVSGIPKQTFPLATITQHIVVYGLAGADSITISGNLLTEIHGGNGKDVISGGSGKDIIWGDDGDDFLQGQAGNDVLIGGRGVDRLTGGSGLDLLFGGGFCKGNRHNGTEAYDFGVLCAISDNYALNGLCDADLFGGLDDDLDDTEQDRLTGGANNPNLPGGGPLGDWFLGNITGGATPFDILTDFLAPDKITSL